MTGTEKATLPDPRWAQVRARDGAADGRFFYSVSTTGVFCRPSCPSRPAKLEHVRFHDSAADARQAGFRPCKRCKPEGTSQAEDHAALVASLCRELEEAEETPTLESLARRAGLSVSQLHRVFRSVTGMTPPAWARSLRAARVRQALVEGGPVTDAIHEAGYGSSSRFYERSTQVLGMTPRRYRQGGDGLRIRFAVGESSLGSILVAATPEGVCAIFLGDEPQQLVHDLEARFPRATLEGGDEAFEQWVAQVVGFVEEPRIGLALPLDLRGTAFQMRVWQALQQLVPGERLTYGELAQRLGVPKAVRAVASACAANTIAVAIPCHRVVRQGGGLSGYRWGVERKRALLEREDQPSGG